MKKTPLTSALVLALSACASAGSPQATIVAAPEPTITSAPLSSTGDPVVVEVGGDRLVIRCFGDGTPAVVLENGYGLNWTEWEEVIAAVQNETRVCAYDRVSPAATSSEIVDDLHAMLTTTGLAKPYILAGHSLGGFTMILYAARYPEEVAGIALIESAHPDENARFLAALPAASADENRAMSDLRAQFTSTTLDGFDWQTSTDQVRAVTSLGDIPLIVIEANPDDISDWPAIGDDDLKRALNAVWHELQAELDGLSSNSTHVIATNSGHMVSQEEPQVVIDAILSLLEAARTN